MNLKHIPLIVFASFFSQSVFAGILPGPLVDDEWLAKNQDKVIVLDVRKDLKSFTGKPAYKNKSGIQKLVKVGGHIPGASLVNYRKVRAKRSIDDYMITRMMPEKTDFEKLMREAGVSKDSVIVVTSKGHSNKDITMSTRVYWQLKYFGHDAVAILDGGTALWIKNGHKVSSEVAKPVKGNWAVTAERKEMLATIKEVGDAVVAAKIQLVDTRTVSEYIGTFSKAYVYDQGHLSGAKNFPNELLTGPKLSARFHSLDTFKKLVKKLKIDTKAETIVYCNSGHLASGSWFVLSELLGNKNVKLYDGSMHQWTIEKRPLVKM